MELYPYAYRYREPSAFTSYSAMLCTISKKGVMLRCVKFKGYRIVLYYNVELRTYSTYMNYNYSNSIVACIMYVCMMYVVCIFVLVSVSGKVRHAQGQRLNRFEVRRKRESERTKGEVEVEKLLYCCGCLLYYISPIL